MPKEKEFASNRALTSWIGTDESGKGDYFGPLAIAGVLVTSATHTALLRLGVREAAIEAYSKGIELDPQNPNNYYNRGNVYGRSLGNFPLAIEDFNRAIDLNPEFVLAYDNRANANYLLGNYQEAIMDCNQAIKLDPKDPLPYFTRGHAYYELGDRRRTINDFRTAARLGLKPAQNFLKSKGIRW